MAHPVAGDQRVAGPTMSVPSASLQSCIGQAGGGDFGAGVITFMTLDDPGPLLGLHLTNLEPGPTSAPSRACPPASSAPRHQHHSPTLTSATTSKQTPPLAFEGNGTGTPKQPAARVADGGHRPALGRAVAGRRK